MRLCLVSAELAPFAGGGGGTYATEMVRALARAGVDTHLLTYPRPGLVERAAEVLPGVAVHTVDLDAGAAAYPAYHCRALRHAMGVFEALGPLHDQHRFDAIEFPDFGGEGYFVCQARRLLGRFADTRLVVRCHTPIAVCRSHMGDARLTRADLIVEHMERTCLRDADLLIAPSRGMLDEIDRVLPGCRSPDRPEIVIANPLDVSSIAQPDPQAASPPPPSGRPIELLCSGRYEHRKGQFLLIDAAGQLLDAGVDLRVTMVGRDTRSGPTGRTVRATLLERIDPGHADRFDLRDRVERDELATLVARADVVVVPSLFENMPYAVAEAMALGKAIVASSAGGTPELIEHERSGLLHTPGDAADLARQLARVISDGQLRDRLGAAARQRVAALCDPASGAARTIEAISRVEIIPPRTIAEHPKPAVSVVIPCFNAGAFIAQTLASVRAQTVLPDEIIIIDDGSTDEHTRSALDTIERDGLARVVRSPHRGVSAARNTGIKQACGTFILMLDADDLIDPSLLAKALGVVERCPAVAVVSPLIASFHDDPATPTGGWVPIGFDRDMLPAVNIAASGSGVLIRRDALQRVGSYDESLAAYEDWDLWCAMARAGHACEIIPAFLLRYRRSPESLMRTQGRPNHQRLMARLLAKHADLPEHPDRTMRLLLTRAWHHKPAQPPPARPGAKGG